MQSVLYIYQKSAVQNQIWSEDFDSQHWQPILVSQGRAWQVAVMWRVGRRQGYIAARLSMAQETVSIQLFISITGNCVYTIIHLYHRKLCLQLFISITGNCVYTIIHLYRIKQCRYRPQGTGGNSALTSRFPGEQSTRDCSVGVCGQDGPPTASAHHRPEVAPSGMGTPVSHALASSVTGHAEESRPLHRADGRVRIRHEVCQRFQEGRVS